MPKSSGEQEKATAPSLTPEPSIHVLLVDDDAGFLKSSKKILELQGPLQIETAISVNDAQKKLQQKPYDVIVADYMMPETDGLEFLKELREDGNDIPFILFTGKGREEIAIEALNLGANRYFNKTGKPEAVYAELTHSILAAVKANRAEKTLQESEEKYRKQVEEALDAIFLADAETGILVDCNLAATELVGRKKSELIGKHQRILHPPEPAKGEFSSAFEQHRREKNLKVIEDQIITKSGEVKDVLISATIFTVEGKRLLQGTFRDITENKKMEEQLRRERETLERVTENVGAGLAIISKDYKILWANKFLKNVFGVIKGKTCYSVLNDCNKVCPGCGVKQIFETGANHVVHEQQVPGSNGQRVWIEITANAIRDEKGNIVAVSELSVNVNERKQLENRLRENEKKFRLLTENTTDVIYIQDMNLRITYASPSVEKVSGYTPEEMSTLSPDKFMTPESFERGVVDFKEAITSSTDDPDYEIPLKQYQYICKDGSTVWGELKMKVLRDSNNNFIGIQGNLRDITERKEAEEKLGKIMNELVAINEKLGVIGKLTRHDARNKLAVIANNVYLTKQRLKNDTDAIEYLGGIDSAVDQMEKIFDFARNYEMLGVEELSYLDVGKNIDEAVILLSGLDMVTVVNECHGLTVMADSLLRQLFYNLVENTLKYGEKVTKIRIYYAEEKNELKLVYEDDGVGIPETEKEKIFQEGYGKGTGYGLYLIKKICEAYGWTIKETGVPGKGAQFTMTIPKTDPKGLPLYRFDK